MAIDVMSGVFLAVDYAGNEPRVAAGATTRGELQSS